MILGEFAVKALGLFFVFLTVIAIIGVIAASGTFSIPQIGNIFNDICAKGGLSIIEGLAYDQRTALIQFYTIDPTNLIFVYPRNTYRVLSSLLDGSKNNLQSSTDLYTGLYSTRVGTNIFKQCTEMPCFCAVRTTMDYLTYIKSNFTLCFPLLYSLNKSGFDSCVDSKFATMDKTSDIDAIVFETCINEMLASNPPPEVSACFNTVNAPHNMFYTGTDGKYILSINDSSNPNFLSDSALILEYLNDFYNHTRGGLITEVLKCVPIPKENSCYCPYVGSNEMVSTKGLFLGIAGSYNSPKPLDITSFVMHLSPTDSACLMRINAT